jgi:hypothetical protein
MRRLLLLAVVPLVGCAPTVRETGDDVLRPPVQPPPEIQSAGAGYYIRLDRDDGISVAALDGSRTDVFQATMSAFDDLGLRIEGGDPAQGLIQSERIVKMAEFAGERMSELLDCGTTLTGNRANSWRIEFHVTAQVEALGDRRSQITTRLIANARPMDGTSRNQVSCTTRGVLEQKITEAAAAKVRSRRG